MTATNSILITMAGWEDRYFLSCEKIISEERIVSVLSFFSMKYSQETHKFREKLRASCQEKGLFFAEGELDFLSPAATWKTIYENVSGIDAKINHAVVDLSTMPREIIWIILDLLSEKGLKIKCVYGKPDTHASDWLTRDPGRPRLVFKLSGISKLGASTVLVIFGGYDIPRVRQLLAFFEPEHAIVCIPPDVPGKSQAVKEDDWRKEFANSSVVQLVELNAFDNDAVFTSLEPFVQRYRETNNLVLSSLGPKLSAIALFLLQRKYPDIALCYTPSGEVNLEYSKGLRETISVNL